MKITFRCEHDDGEIITFQTAPDIDSYELIQDFERFMRCCSYDIDGSLEIVPEEYDDEDEFVEETGELVQSDQVWNWTVNELIKNADRNQVEHIEAPVSKDFFSKSHCPLCGLETELMRHEDCYDTYCPKNEDANKR